MALLSRPLRTGLLSALVLSVLAAPAGSFAQSRSQFNERTIEPELNAFDTAGVWTLHFRFKDPRSVTVDVPGRGRKIVWYMWFQVYNTTGEPRLFVPEFELVTIDKNTVHTDEVLPSVQTYIAKIEDPTGRYDIKNTVSVQKELIPVTKKESFPRAVTGVAIWTDVYDRAANTNRFSVFVSGLSDGLTKDDRGVIRKKTLRLDFTRASDGRAPDSANDIKWTENYTWIYRATASTGGEGGKEPAEAPKKEELEPKKEELKKDEKKEDKKDEKKDLNVGIPQPLLRRQ